LIDSDSSDLSSPPALPSASGDDDDILNENLQSEFASFLEYAYPAGTSDKSWLRDLFDGTCFHIPRIIIFDLIVGPIDEHNIAPTVDAGNDAIQSPPPPANSVSSYISKILFGTVLFR
jgi:hypothetical protein